MGKKAGKYFAAALVIFMLLSVFTMKADAVDIENYYQEILKFDEQGNLIMTVHDRKATANVTYRTIGWTIKRYNLPIDAPGNQCARIKLEENMPSRPDPNNNAYIYSYFYCSKDDIFNSIGRSSSEWQEDLYQNGGMVYLDAVMTVCVKGVPQGSLTDGGAGYTGEVYFTFEGIANARKWANPDSLRTHFNKSLYFPENKEMLPGRFNVFHLEAEGDDYENAKSLERYGKDIVGAVLEAKEYTFLKEDFSAYLYEYKRTHIVAEYKDGRKTDYWTSGDQGDSGMAYINNLNDGYKNIDIFFYYGRNEKQQERTDFFNWDDNGSRISKTLSIKAEKRGSEEFDVSLGIPTGETVYVEGEFSKYRYICRYGQTYGYKTYGINIRIRYILRWRDNSGTLHEEESYKEKMYYADRYYSFWEIKNLELHYIDSVKTENYIFGKEGITLEAESSDIGVLQESGKENHLQEPFYPGTIELYGGIIDGGGIKPEVPETDNQTEAEAAIGQIQVKNDLFSLEGIIILDNADYQGTSPEPSIPSEDIKEKVLREGILVPHTKKNGENYPSTGKAYYRVYGELSTKEINILDINGVSIHTPVACSGTVSDDRGFNQEISPDKEKASMILGRTFTVSVDTRWEHRPIKGYGDRDYMEYADCRQVRFPFEVYYNGNLIKQGNWIDFEQDSMTLHLPEGVIEGDYVIEFRTIAKNHIAEENSSSMIEANANLNPQNYAASDSAEVRVIGRLFGFQIIDICDYPRWMRVFRRSDGISPTGFRYKVGTKDQNGEEMGISTLYVIPVIKGSHPFNINAGAVRSGYHMKFKLKTIGSMYGEEDYIHIKPTFWYIDKNGKGRREVDLYYNGMINGEKEEYVKIGSLLDKENIMSTDMLGMYSLAPENGLKSSAELLGVDFSEFYGNPVAAYTFGNIMLSEKMRNFIGNIDGNVEDRVIAQKSVQEWYGEYHLPAELFAVDKRIDLREYFGENGKIKKDDKVFLRDGYIVVNLEIETLKNRNPTLNYINVENSSEGYCNMWKTEGFLYSRRDASEMLYEFQDGDAFIYDLDASVKNDYRSMGTH